VVAVVAVAKLSGSRAGNSILSKINLGGANKTSEQPEISPTGVIGSPTPTIRGDQTSQIALNITAPVNGTVVTSATLAVKGKTAAKAQVAVNDKETVADAAGNFSVNLTLDEGDNDIIAVANDSEGNMAEQELTVTYQPGQ
jgi:hypothetical protein